MDLDPVYRCLRAYQDLERRAANAAKLRDVAYRNLQEAVHRSQGRDEIMAMVPEHQRQVVFEILDAAHREVGEWLEVNRP